MEIDYGKQVFDNYFSQAVTILTIFLISGKGRFYEFFDDTIIFLSILLPTILRFFLTDHRYWGIVIIILGLSLIYFLYEFHYTSTKTDDESKIFKYFRQPLTLLIRYSSLIPFYMTIYIFYLPLAVEVYDDSKKIVSPFESPKYISSFCLNKSNDISCKVSYYIRLYIVWFSVLICLIDFGLYFTFLNTSHVSHVKFSLGCLSPLRFIWFVILSLTPGVVFGILLSDENYYLYKISTGLSISACVSIIKHYVGKDVHTFFSHYLNHHRMFKKSIVNLEKAVDIICKLEDENDPETKKEKLSNNKKKGTRKWVRKYINKTSTCILKITDKLKEKVIPDHKIDEDLNKVDQSIDSNQHNEVFVNFKDVSSQITKEIIDKLEKNIGSDLRDEINSNLTHLIDSKFRKINSNNEKDADPIEDISSKLSKIKKDVTKLFSKLEDAMEGCGLYQILTEEDKCDIERNSQYISNINIYLEKSKELMKKKMEELSDIKSGC